MQLEVGSILEGKVTGITNFGAFVDLPNSASGMVHISEVAPNYVSQIKDHLKVGQEVKVKVLSIGDDGKVSLSIKKAMENQKNTENGNFNNHQRSNSNNGNNNANKDRGRFNSRPNNGQRPPRKPYQPAPQVHSPGNYEWHSKKNDSSSFEDMMNQFKQSSDEKISVLKKGEVPPRRRKPQK